MNEKRGNEHDQERMKTLLQQALPPMEAAAEPSRDLWPAVLRKLDERPAATPPDFWVWFDWALLGGMAVLVASSPASIPVLLYFL